MVIKYTIIDLDFIFHVVLFIRNMIKIFFSYFRLKISLLRVSYFVIARKYIVITIKERYHYNESVISIIREKNLLSSKKYLYEMMPFIVLISI